MRYSRFLACVRSLMAAEQAGTMVLTDWPERVERVLSEVERNGAELKRMEARMVDEAGPGNLAVAPGQQASVCGSLYHWQYVAVPAEYFPY